MESFYGGRQGASFVIKKRFDAISIPQSQQPVYRRRYYARELNEGAVIWPLVERDGTNENEYSWGLYTLDGSPIEERSQNHFPTETAEGMVEFFLQGAATTSEVNYGEYVIIDTVSGLNDTQSVHNGKIYMRTPDITNGLGGAVYIGQITGMTYVDNVTISWSNVLNKPNGLVADPAYQHTDNNFTNTLKSKLDGISAGAQVNVNSDWEEDDPTAAEYILNKPANLSDFNNDLDLINDNNTSSSKTFSSSKINELLAAKVTSQVGKSLSDNNFSDALKNKLDNIEAQAQKNVTPDWDAQEGDPGYIDNKPEYVRINDEEALSDATYSSSRIEDLITTLMMPISQIDYDNLLVKDPRTFYIICREEEIN